jgi:hypothetical protein
MIRYFIIGGVILLIIIIIIIIAASSSKDDGNSSEGDGNTSKDDGNTSKDDGNSSKGDQNSDSTETVSGSCPKITYIDGGMSGSGFASRYWDCCKPSCSWTENAGSGNEAKQCDVNMNLIQDHSSKNICEGGPAATCLSQIPFIMDGCDNIGFAFAAVPGHSPTCGRCFLLEFTGQGKYESKKKSCFISKKKAYSYGFKYRI